MPIDNEALGRLAVQTHIDRLATERRYSMLPHDKQSRKERPMARGFLDYFPDAMAAVANISYIANEQHNPGEPMHWSKEKSSDHADALLRHLVDRGGVDDDGLLHTAKVAWRAMALLQTEIDLLSKTEQEALAKQRWARIPQTLDDVKAMDTTEEHPRIPSGEAWDKLVEKVQAQADELLLTHEGASVRTVISPLPGGGYSLDAIITGENLITDGQDYPDNAASDDEITLGDGERTKRLVQALADALDEMEWTVPPAYPPLTAAMKESLYGDWRNHVDSYIPPAPSLWSRVKAFVAHTLIALAFRFSFTDAWNASQTEIEMLYEAECHGGF